MGNFVKYVGNVCVNPKIKENDQKLSKIFIKPVKNNNINLKQLTLIRNELFAYVPEIEIE